MRISNYDQFDYDYSKYWKNRSYEHLCEVSAINSLKKKIKGKWFLDVGGSYGRHIPSYYSSFEKPVIIDYSLNTLISNKERIWKEYPNTSLIAANIYFMPFKQNTFDGGMMVRVLHHIENPQKYFSQLSTILKNKAIFFQEFANKIHIKAVLKHLLRFDFKFFSIDPFQQPTHKSFEGTAGVESVFLNFHPNYIKRLVTENGFTVLAKRGVSYLRIPLLKRFISPVILMPFEKLLQVLLGNSNIAPSIFYKLRMDKLESNSDFNDLEDILVCPKCKSDLVFKNEECICSKCKSRYEKVAGIWDFRVQ